MFLGLCIAVAVVVAAYVAYDWRRTSRLKRDLASGTGTAPEVAGTPGPDARHGLDAHAHLSRSHGNTSHGAGYV